MTFRRKDGTTFVLRGRAGIAVSDMATGLRLAEAGSGVAILPDLITLRAISARTLVQIFPDWTLPGLKLHALTLAGRDVPVRVRLFRAFLQDALAKPPVSPATIS